ncbi:MAG TPA: amidohydrolase family protein [Candidatus Polarisedimenticolaceae bacterium]|nr:amidohydrolase family protein [Candidatus Polarisedimenticolaceae bacterium]
MNRMKLILGRRACSLDQATVLVLAAAAILATTTMASAAAATPSVVKRGDAPDLVLYNGKISTVDVDDATVDAIAIRDGKILATGGNGPIRALAKQGTQVIDLHGRRVLPGLIDGHLHGIRMGSYFCFSRSPRFDPIFTRSEAIANVALKAAQTPIGKWLFQIGGGWHVQQLDIPGMLTKAELDTAAPNHPVYLQGTGFTGGQVNTRGLQVLGLDPAGNGQLTGDANTLAIRTIGTELGTLTLDEQDACTVDFIHELNRRGLTGWDDPGGNNPFSPTGVPDPVIVGSHGYQAINRLYREGRLNARVRFSFSCFGNVIGMPCVQGNTVNALSGIGDDLLRIGGVGEEVLNLTAGIYADPEYAEILLYLAQNEWSFEHHATAPATQQAMVASWERVNSIAPITELAWRMLHPGGGPEAPSPDTLARLKALNAGVVPTNSNAKSGGVSDHPPYRRIYESGTRACLGTDALNVSPYPPFLNLWYVISGKTTVPGVAGVVPEQRLTRAEALRFATEKCSWFIDLEGQVGSLAPGNYADLIVLNKDYFAVPEDEIRTLTSVLTVLGGRIVYADAEYAGLDRP